MQSHMDANPAGESSPDFDAGALIAQQANLRRSTSRTSRWPRRFATALLLVGVLVGLVVYRGEIQLQLSAIFDRAVQSQTVEIALPPASTGPADEAPADERGEILYYRNPMGLPDISPVPKKDSMGMDYLPVYENEVATDDGTIRVSAGRIQTLGVTNEVVQERILTDRVRAFGTVVLDETRVWVVTTKLAGWIDRLYVNETGAKVAAGSVLFELFSPDLYDLEVEYVIAANGLGSTLGATNPEANRITSAVLQRLRNWGVPEVELQRIEAERVPSRTIPIFAPASGRILERMGLPGMRIEAGEPIYRMADLSKVWVIAEVYEKDLAAIAVGLESHVEIAAYPGERFVGTVALVYPELDPETRRARVRIDIDNSDERLRPGMLAEISIVAPMTSDLIIAVPESAVLDSGVRQIVLVDLGDGRYQPRAVQLGRSADGYREIISGIAVGERVVTSANFLLDSESNLQAALDALAAGALEP